MQDDGSWATQEAVALKKTSLISILKNELCTGRAGLTGTRPTEPRSLNIQENFPAQNLVGFVQLEMKWVCVRTPDRPCCYDCRLKWTIKDELDLNVDDNSAGTQPYDIITALIAEVLGVHYYDPGARVPGPWIFPGLPRWSRWGFQAFPWEVRLEDTAETIDCENHQ
jgi:hypothetical protein